MTEAQIIANTDDLGSANAVSSSKLDKSLKRHAEEDP